jgi:hypothetical protein
MAYASRTGTKRNLAAFRLAGWRILISAQGVLRTEGFPYAIDNGAWTAHTKGIPFDVAKFVKAVEMLGADADWVACPDIVCGGMESLTLSLKWLPWVLARTRVALIPVQPGMTADDLAPYLGYRVGLFVGGDDEWKDRTMGEWSRLAHRHGALCHVGRVNTRGRIRLCAAAGADSFDGTSGSRFAVNVPIIDSWRRQTSLLSMVN